MSNTAEFGTFVHPETQEAYLFGFEQYQTPDEMSDLWKDAIHTEKLESGVPYGELGVVDLIDPVVTKVGLLRPEPNSELATEMRTFAARLIDDEAEEMDTVARLGYDPADDHKPEPSVMQRLIRNSLEARRHL